ncbi:exonuclease, partial [Klebsiella pneumoniae]|nr:exonuclease [Klebsiella pneumoniae]
LMMSLWDALRMNMMISYQELVRTFPNYHGYYRNRQYY